MQRLAKGPRREPTPRFPLAQILTLLRFERYGGIILFRWDNFNSFPNFDMPIAHHRIRSQVT